MAEAQKQRVVLRAALAGALLFTLAACTTAPLPVALRTDYASTPEQAASELAATQASLRRAADWQSRAAILRAGILRATGIDLRAERMPPVVHWGAARRHEGYTVRNFTLETLPGYFCTGSCYEPETAGRHAAVLLPHGHFNSDGGGRFQPDIQILAATLARAGAIVCTYDMVGWGNAQQYDHKQALTLSLQLWNSLRLVDWLSARAEVDRTRLAITGASGGATQSFLLAAVDERIAVSVPVVQVSAYFFGGCPCESGLPIHQQERYRTNNVEIAALAAPRPQLVITDGKDWTQHTPQIGVPFLRHVYALLGASDALASAHFADEGHDYGASKRRAAVNFLAAKLSLSLVSDWERQAVTIETPAILNPWTPGNAPGPSEEVAATIRHHFSTAIVLPFPETPKK